MRVIFGFRASRVLLAVFVAPWLLVASSPLPQPQPSASLPGSSSEFSSGQQDGETGSTNSMISPAESAITFSTTTMPVRSPPPPPTTTTPTASRSTAMPLVVPTQTSDVSEVLGYTPNQREGLDRLTYAFEYDGLDGTSALTFSNVIQFQENVWEKLNSRLSDIEAKEVLMIALLAGIIGGLLMCGLAYIVYVLARCCNDRRRARRHRKIEERNSFTMVSPDRSARRSEKGSPGSRWTNDSTPATKQVSLRRIEEMELADRTPPSSDNSRIAATPSSGPTPAAPRLAIVSTTSTPSKKTRPSTGGTTVSDILAGFDFDVDEDAPERGDGGGEHGDDTQEWPAGARKISEEGSQIGIVTGKNSNGAKGQKKDPKFWLGRKGDGQHF